jgi:hypothetical protein
MTDVVVISAAVEGDLDEAVARRLITHAGGIPGPIYGKNGKQHIRQRVASYNRAAQRAPWLVLVDLDHDFECAPPLGAAWLPARAASKLCFRVAVRAVEAWLMADAERLAQFLGVARSRIPRSPEQEDHPKTGLVNLARRSRRRDVREDIVPRAQSGRAVGPAYSSRLIEYVASELRPDVAAQRAGSLRRAVNCLKRLVEVA